MAIKLQLNWHAANDRVSVDQALVDLLDAIADTGRLTEAAQQLGCSYRHAWDRLKSVAHNSGTPLAVLAKGRGAQLTAAGEELRQNWRELDVEVGRQIAEVSAQYDDRLARIFGIGGKDRPVRIAASHGFAVAVLGELLPRIAARDIEFHNHGTCESLERLARQQCDVAGFHIPVGALGQRLVPVLGQWLDPRRHRVMLLETREQGLIFAQGRALRDIHDLANNRLRFVNRQPGAGSRLIFDMLLADAGLAPRDIQGYADEEHTHSAVAALIASGAADAGFGIATAARRFGLEFLPMVRERYFLAVARTEHGRGCLDAIQNAVRSEAFTTEMARIPAVDLRDTGTVLDDFTLDDLWADKFPPG